MIKITFLAFCLTATISCLTNEPDCTRLMNGRFHIYPNNMHKLIIRQDSIHLEINPLSSDTSFWKVNWLTKCKFSLKYIRGIKMESEAQGKFYRLTVIECDIQKIQSKYYISTSLYKMPSGNKFITDTTWLNER